MGNEYGPPWVAVEPLREFQRPSGLRQIKTASGKKRRVPALPYEYWCKSSGNVVRLVVMTTRNVKDAIDPQRYADFTRRRAVRDGWFPWEYAAAMRYTPHVVAGMSPAQWEKWREEEKTRRQTRHNEESAEFGAAWTTERQKRKEDTQEAFSAAIKDLTEMVRGRTAREPK